ncbi:hypothetical protein [Citrobacter portucalensis]|uniref:hypothetical protein n=1 Tax=Citrobacter portucalensis TaxID=1639133 RepID=UPI00301B6E02
MASNKKPNYSAKVKYWADGVTGQCSGGIVGCIEMLFFALPKDKREKCLKGLRRRACSSIRAWNLNRLPNWRPFY